MSTPLIDSLHSQNRSHMTVDHDSLPVVSKHPAHAGKVIFLMFLAAWTMLIAGCGTGGYAGGGINGLSSSAVILDAGQSFIETSKLSGSPTVTWSLTGGSCSGNSCGTLSSTTGASVTYTAPANITGQMSVTLTGAVSGTGSSSAVSITVNPDPAITGTAASGTVGVTYSYKFTSSGGTAPLKWSIASGTLPDGLSFDASTGIVSGTPTTIGTSKFTLQLTDASNVPYTVTSSQSITIAAVGASLSVAPGNPPAGTVGSAYTTTLQAAGGASPYTWSIISGALPAGLSLDPATGVISGIPTTQGSFPFTAQVQDSTGATTSASLSIAVNAASSALTVTQTNLPGATVGTPYNTTIGATGGTAPYNCSVTDGTLPAGITLTGCTLSGTPTTAGTSTFTVTVTDSGNPPGTASSPETITVAPASSTPIVLSLGLIPPGTVGVPYSAPIGVTGGTAPYSCSVTGTLPAGITLTGCTLSGTPTTAGSSTFTVSVTDSSNPPGTSSSPVTLAINPAQLSLTSPTLPAGTVGSPYSAPIGATGGTSPYSCAITSGTFPAGLTLTGCTVSGTPTTAGTSNVTVQVTDSGNPAQSATGPVSLTIAPAPLTLAVSSLPNGTQGSPYSASIGATGGTSPYSCAITSGTLPAGLTLTGCTVSGTPTSAGTSNLTVRVTDSSNPAASTSGPVSLTITPPPLTLAVSSLPNGTQGSPYSASIGATGGTSPYSCSIASGALPAGLTLTGCTVSGTPTVAGTSNLTVKVIDSSNPAASTTGPISLVIAPATGTLTLTSPPAATVNVSYSGPIGVSGGTSPYSCSLVSGTLPAGLSLTGCTVTGTPTTAGSTSIMVKATDSSLPTAVTTTAPVTVTVSPAGTLTLAPLPNATVSTPYSEVIGVSGGTGPYNCTVTGTLPAGLHATGCTISGTPTTAGTSSFSVTATDSSSPTAITTTGPVSLTVSPVSTLTLDGSLPNAILGQPYTQTLNATGGVTPYVYSVTAGTLPAGLTLDPATGTISGTPTAPGASSFTVTVTDAETTQQTASLPLVLLVAYPTTPNDAELTGPYAFLFQGYDDVALGVFAYQTASVGSFTADGTGGVISGEIDSNHATPAPTGAIVSTNEFIGTYTIDANHQGSLTITILNPDGTTGSATYAISVKAPIAPATVSTEASFVEYDNANLVGTKGSGTLLLQQPTAFSTGLSGSYVFGMSGDAPCLPTCTLGVIAGPAAAVGQFTASGSTITGTGDSNIATTNYPTEVLTGNYGTPDGNGRISLTLDTANTPAGVYPTDFAVYAVSSTQAFLLSLDNHSAYVLLAGSAQQQQTPGSYSNASMTGPFIGYENAATNPNLVTGLALENVLNFSTATIFRGTATADGNCNITNYDEGGLTGLVNGVTGLVSSLLQGLLQGLLGPSATTGAITCDVSSYGRGTLQYPKPNLLTAAPAPRVFYLSSPNTGYFLESGYAGLGNLEPQTGAPFTEGTFSGTFVYGSTTAASLASINSAGYIVANGSAGTATSVLSQNIGVGNINLLQLTTTPAMPFTLLDPTTGDPATTGRYTFGTDVIYAINPNRFVLVDIGPLTTSPTVNLLY